MNTIQKIAERRRMFMTEMKAIEYLLDNTPTTSRNLLGRLSLLRELDQLQAAIQLLNKKITQLRKEVLYNKFSN